MPATNVETTTTITINIPGDPVAQGKPRFTTINGFARAYDPAKSRSWKGFAATIARAANVTPFDGPVQVTIDAVFKRPKSLPKRYGTGRLHRPSRPDCDNLAKAVLDALQGIAFADDAYVVDLRVRKWVAAQNEMPHVEVTIENVEATLITTAENNRRPVNV